MNKKALPTTWAVVLCALAVVLVLGGARWLWHFILTMHGMR
jgi:hypothetical protein